MPKVFQLTTFLFSGPDPRDEKFIPTVSCPHNPGPPPPLPGIAGVPTTGERLPARGVQSTKFIFLSQKMPSHVPGKYFCCFFVNVRL